MNNYFIVLDLDGTLLNDSKQISEYDKLILKKCQEKGCKIVINTTRNYLRTVRYQEEINADYVNCFNGNLVIGDKTIYKNPFPNKITNKIMNILLEYGYDFLIELHNGTYRTRYEKYDAIDSYYFKPECIKINDCFKFLVECDKDQVLELSSLFHNNNCKLSYDEENNFMRILPKDTNKYNGLKKIIDENAKLISFGNDKEDYETLKQSYLGIKMQNSSRDLDAIEFNTLSNNENGVGKFLNNYFNFDVNFFSENIKILDCTLRDGGHINSSNFGKKNIKSIIQNLVNANIDYVEMGFLEDIEFNENVSRYPTVKDAEKIIEDIDCKNTCMCLLTQVDKFNIKNLSECEGKIKMIRVSFHSNLVDEGIEYCKQVKNKGYICACNPINFSNYTNEEIIDLVKKINEIDVNYFTIVDTFGLMLNNDFKNKLNLLSSLLKSSIKIGLHLHDNLSSSFSTAQILVQNKSKFNEIIIDTSLDGMGRSPGNLKTELLSYYINLSTNRYNLHYIYKLLENEMKELKEKYNWVNDFRYSISAFEKVHRSYAEFLIKNDINYEDSCNIIRELPLKNKGRYSEEIISNIKKDYFKEKKNVFR